MKEAKIFESWIDNLAEGTWNLPETPEQLDKLKTMMASELIVGPDAINATEQLYDLVGDDILFDRLSELAAKDPRANAWNDTEVMNRLAKLGIEMPEPSVPGNPAEPATAPVTEGPAVDAYMSGKSPALAHFADQLDKSTEQAVSESAELNTMLKYAGIPLTEGVLDDVRARMDARRNPAAATPATAQPVQSPTTQVPKFKVGDTVSFGIGRGVPSTGTITAMGPGPTQLTVKTAEGENQLDTRMKSLYLQLATATTSAESQQSTPDLPRAEVVSTMGMPSRSLIGYKDNTYTPSGPYTKAPEGATGTQVLVPAAAFGIRSMGDVVALLTDDGTAYAEQPIKVSNPFGRSAAPTAQLSQGLDEADEWEEETGKFQRFLEYVKKTLMRERDPKRRIETANYLSKQENKFFGSPISSASEQTPFGSVNTGKAFTDIIKGIMDDIQSGNLHYEQQAVQAAIWLEPEGKQFLKKAHNDFIQMIDHSSKEREQHAIALSGYQIQNLGGRVIGDPLKGGVTNNPVARMTPEIYGVFELAEAELRRMKGEREDEEERQQTVAMWNALPMPLKLAAAAAVGKTPAQLEKILLAKNEIEAVGGLDVSDFPNLPQQADADEFEKPEDETPNNSTDKKDKPVAEGQGATTYTVAYKDPTKPGKSHSTQVKATSAAEAKAAFQEWDTTNRFTYLGSRPDVDTVREGVAEAAELNTMLKYAGIPVKESVLTDSTGSTLEHIKNTFRRDVKDFTQTGNMSDPLYDALYDYYFDDMPYGTKKARDGDPYEWISNRFSDDIGLDEGWKGAIAGGLAGGALGSVVPALGTLAGAAAGAYAGHKLGDQGFKDPDAEYKKAQKLKQQPSVDEADAISTFEVMSGFDAPVAEGSCNMTSEGAYCPEHGLAECAMEEEKDITTPGEKILGATTGAAIGALAGNYIGDRSSIGTLGGLALGGIAGNKIATTAGNKNVGNKINQDSNWGVGEQQPAEGWKGELAGGTAGGIAGTLAGTALGGPVGGLIGGAAGGTGGAMIGRKLTKETGSYYESREGDAMLARIKSLALLK